MAVALELGDDVDQVLQDPGSGDPAVLGHVPHEQHRDAALLGHRDECAGHGPDLGNASGTALDLRRGDGLNRVHHQQGGAGRLHVPQQGPELGLRGQEQPGVQGVDALGPQPHL